jgi:hypothetical protein
MRTEFGNTEPLPACLPALFMRHFPQSVIPCVVQLIAGCNSHEHGALFWPVSAGGWKQIPSYVTQLFPNLLRYVLTKFCFHW